ncbi:hypothetical protein A7P53_06335 [Acinetobacter defluvii]|uniref:tetratricopeptide repeat protein n=1 Tax=Acinetobacter defluvii TaxID=1871111 RepID=UPI00148F4983|nr:tetratricopeptide repeat protein [Acinetobacter defluvii]NNP72081.1 hypothetical protein [Acinetobacter defluvii]
MIKKGIFFATSILIVGLTFASTNKNSSIPEGSMVFNEDFVKKDGEAAFKYYLKAAEQGDADAQTSIGKMYQNGRYWVEMDLKKAFEWFLKAAEQNNKDAQFYVGYAYYHGLGVDEDYKTAFYWIRVCRHEILNHIIINFI